MPVCAVMLASEMHVVWVFLRTGRHCVVPQRVTPFRWSAGQPRSTILIMQSHLLQAEIELEQLQRDESGSVMATRNQVRTVTAGWLVGVILGWAAGFVLGCLFSPALGFMMVKSLSLRRHTENFTFFKYSTLENSIFSPPAPQESYLLNGKYS